jgi:hypothetical protein
MSLPYSIDILGTLRTVVCLKRSTAGNNFFTHKRLRVLKVASCGLFTSIRLAIMGVISTGIHSFIFHTRFVKVYNRSFIQGDVLNTYFGTFISVLKKNNLINMWFTRKKTFFFFSHNYMCGAIAPKRTKPYVGNSEMKKAPKQSNSNVHSHDKW